MSEPSPLDAALASLAPLAPRWPRARRALLVFALAGFVVALWPRWKDAGTSPEDQRFEVSLGLLASSPLLTFEHHETKKDVELPNGGRSVSLDYGQSFDFVFTSWSFVALALATVALEVRRWLGKRAQATPATTTATGGAGTT